MVDQILPRKTADQQQQRTTSAVLSFLRKLVFAAMALLLWQTEAQATHAMGGELSYKCLGNNRWEVTLAFYRDCNGIAAPTSCSNGLQFKVRSASCGINFDQCFSNNTRTVVDITPLCANETSRCSSTSGTYGIQRYTWTKVVDLSSYASCSANDWSFEWSLCCRNNAITSLNNPGNRDLFLDARLNNAPGLCNNSPTFTNDPAAFYCLGEQISYNPGAVDVDGDSLVYSLVQPRHSSTSVIPYNSNYNLQNPIRNTSGGVSLDSQTGTMTVTPSVIQVAVITYRVDEYRNGVLIGSVTRDVQFIIRPCLGNQPPSVSGIDSTANYTLQVCAGTPIAFYVYSHDANSTQKVRMVPQMGIAGASFYVDSTSSQHYMRRPRGLFQWTPTVADIGTYNFTIKVEDDGCPLKATNDYGYTIKVTPPVTPVNAGADFAVCGPGATMAAPPLPYSGLQGTWSVVSGSGTFTDSHSRTTTVSGLTYGANVFRWTVNYQCGTAYDDVTVTAYNDFQDMAAVGGDLEICGPPNMVAHLSGNVAVLPAVGTWSFVAGSGTIADPNMPNTQVTNLAFGTNRLRWTINNGPCGSTQAEMVVTVYNSAQAAANAGADINICSGISMVTLNGNAATAPATGTWSSVSGGGTITNPSLRNTTVTGLTVGVHKFRWTIDNGVCTPGTTSDEVTVTVYDGASPVADAGADREVCGTASVGPLSGSVPIAPSTGTWTRVSGSGTILSPNSPSTTVSGLAVGNNVFEWTVNNGPCAGGVSSSQVTITVYDENVSGAFAGTDRSFCLPTNSVTMQANAVAAPALGTWSRIQGTGTIVNANSATTTVNGLSVGENIFVWSISNGPCVVTPPSDTVSIFIYDNNAPAANAGPDQTLCGVTTTSLQGNAATFPATGEWSVVAGNGNFTAANSPTTNVTGLGLGVNTFRWTINNGPCANPISFDDVTITVYDTGLPAAYAGLDQELCAPQQTSTSLAGSALSGPATGTWTRVSGTGNIVSPGNPNTQVTGLAVGDNIFRWTVLNGGCANDNTSDDVLIRVFNSNNLPADAGQPQELCTGPLGTASTTLVGSALIYPAAGEWTHVGGSGTPNIATSASSTTAVSGLAVGSHIFRWTVDNGQCGPGLTSSEVLVTVYDSDHPAVTVIEENNITELCIPTGAYDPYLRGTQPIAPATGQWTLVSGTGTILSPNNYHTGLADLGVGDNVFQWTITNGPCPFPDNSAQITISVYDGTMPTADAGPDQDLCTTSAGTASTTLQGSALIGLGTGLWTYVSGPGAPVIADPTSPVATVSNLVAGPVPHVFRWTVNNGPCAVESSDEVEIMVNDGDAQEADAGSDQARCSNDMSPLVLAAVPIDPPATGTWSSPSGSINIQNPGSPTTTVTGLEVGANILIWSVNNGFCGTSTDQMLVTVYDADLDPASIMEGAQLLLCSTGDTTITLHGSAISGPATGLWTVQSGAASVVSPNSSTTVVNGLTTGDHVLRWTVDNGICGTTSAEITIRVFSRTAQNANAGADVDLCSTTDQYQLNANVAVPPGQGHWSATDPGITFFPTASTPSATAQGLSPGDNFLVWTINNGICGTSTDTVNIRVFDEANPAVSAGADATALCTPEDSVLLIGSALIYPATGQWTLVDGSGTLDQDTEPQTWVTGLEIGDNTFRWTVDNGPCPLQDASAEVTITLHDGSVNGAYAGPDQNLCTPDPVTSALTNANAAPYPAQGTWTIVDSPDPLSIAIADIHASSTTISGLSVGVHTFAWSITNGPCDVDPPSDTLTIHVFDQNNPRANAGTSQSLCSDNNSTTLDGSAVTFPAQGTWTIVASPDPLAVVIADINLPNTAISNLPVGETILAWTVDNGPCADAVTTDQVSIFVYNADQDTAQAGNDQFLCTPLTNATLEGNEPEFPATGTWTRIAGQGTITDAGLYNTTVTGLGVGENIFVWTLDNGPCAQGITTDTVSVFLFDSNNPGAHAGDDQWICLPTDQVQLDGSAIIFPATGRWMRMAGSGDIVDETDPETWVHNLDVGANIFRWIVSNGPCSIDSSEVIIYVYDDQNLQAHAGDDQEICTPNSTITMAGSAVTYPAEGTWTSINGTGVITSPHDPQTTVIDLPVGTHEFEWLVDNGPCNDPISRDTMVVRVYDRTNPVAYAGEDREECTSNGPDYELHGSALISPAVGTWSVVGGSGNFSDELDPNTTVSGLSLGDNTFRWTVYNGPCDDSPGFAEITIRLYDGDLIVSAGPDPSLSLCSSTLSYQMQGSALSGPASGYWTTDGDGQIADPVDPQTIVTQLGLGENVFVWTVDNGICGSDRDTVRITVYDADNVPSFAGNPQDLCTPVTSTQLEGSAVNAPGIGVWVPIQGPGTIVIEDENDPHTTVSGLGVGINTFEWRVDNGPCLQSQSTVDIIVFDLNAPQANAGIDSSFCGPPGPLVLYGNAPTGLIQGEWTVPGHIDIDDLHDPMATITGLDVGVTTLTWTFDNGQCGISASEVSFWVYNPDELEAFAGDDQEFCTPQDTTFLAANTPTFPAFGTWTVEDELQTSILFDDIHDPETKVVGLAIGSNVLRWTTYNGACGDTTTSIVTITVFSDSTSAAYAGEDQEVCWFMAPAETQLTASTPQYPATGSWSIVGGSGVIDPADSANVNATITGLEPGITTLVWTLHHPCDVNPQTLTDTVQITVYNAFAAESVAGDTLFLCTPVDTVNMAANTPEFPAFGTWELVSGTGQVADIHDPGTAITGLEVGINKFSWTVYSGDCGIGGPAVSTVAIYVYDTLAPPASIADHEVEVCSSEQTITLAHSAPTYPGEGEWSSVGGGVQFDAVDESTTTVVVGSLQLGDNLLVWTIDNGTCGTTSDTVLVRVYDASLTSIGAGANVELCSTTMDTLYLEADPVDYPAFGYWTVVSGSGTFTDSTAYNSAVLNLGLGANEFAWVVDNGPCDAISGQVTVTLFDGHITTVNAGDDQAYCGPLGQVELAATGVAEPATGMWAILGGPGSIANGTDPHATLAGLSTGITELSWTINNGPCPGLSDTVVITIYDGNLDGVSAGSNQQFCEPGMVTVDMFATPVQLPATGHWSIVGEGAITDPADPHTTVTDVGFGSTILIWTVNNGECPSISAEMTISVFDSNEVSAHAGPHQTICHDTTYTRMDALPLTSTGSGHWELIEGHGELTAPDEHDAEVTGLQLGTNIFRWVVDNGVCPSSADTMLITLRDCSILVVPDAFSPNGDGVNDIYTVEGLEYYPDNTFQVFNRWGAKVFEASPYRNTWDGISGAAGSWGSQLPESTYYFILDPGSGHEVITGYIYLRR